MAFDPGKDQRNREKHGISLARRVDMTMWAVLHDDRVEYGEERYRAFGEIDGHPQCLVFTVRDGEVRPISLRRAHQKEVADYEAQNKNR